MTPSPALLLFAATWLAAAAETPAARAAEISGELRQWHCVTLTFAGPASAETAEPNPFRDYRLDVEFSQDDKHYIVPGCFAADGNAAETGATEGNRWRVHFTPDETGKWTYRASLRNGRDVALSDKPSDGQAVALDGASGELTIARSDKTGRDHRAKGMLRYAGEHYLRFAASGEFFIKGGADSPENFLACADFDQTPATHRYQPHERDWRTGDPTWRGGKGKGIIGALNYLAGQGMNSLYFLTMNVDGDGKDVWPWIDPKTRDRFDCSKLDQWEIVFAHMDHAGLLLHVITQETENDQLLDGGELGTERKLYYRELIARFAHHLAVVWNLGEENTNTSRQRAQFAAFVHALDPYKHPVVVHTFPDQYDQVYTPLLTDPNFHGPSLQMGKMRAIHAETLKWVRRSNQSGRRWIVCLDEIGPPEIGVAPDAVDPDHDLVRQQALWGNLMAGGAGCEWYFGYKFPHSDLTCEDFRSRERMWQQTRYALEFFQKHLPFAQMRPADDLLSPKGGYCFAKPGEVYAVYLPAGGSAELTVPGGRYTVKWFNPRSGGPLVDGTVEAIHGPGNRALGEPPSEKSLDWAVLVRAIRP